MLPRLRTDNIHTLVLSTIWTFGVVIYTLSPLPVRTAPIRSLYLVAQTFRPPPTKTSSFVELRRAQSVKVDECCLQVGRVVGIYKVVSCTVMNALRVAIVCG